MNDHLHLPFFVAKPIPELRFPGVRILLIVLLLLLWSASWASSICFAADRDSKSESKAAAVGDSDAGVESPGVESPSDLQIKVAAERALLYDENTLYSDIEVEADKGVVSLTGFTASLPIKRYATEVVETVTGAKSIVNRVVVRGADRTDEEISEDLENIFKIDSATAGVAVNTIINDGVVRLHGKVGSYDMSRAAEELAESVRGVKGVLNLLHIEPAEPREAVEIEQHLNLTLRQDPLLQTHQVGMEVDADKGEVTLRGTVASLAERRHLLEQIQRVSGVKKIDSDELAIIPGLQMSSEKKIDARPRPDADIERSIKLALREDPRLRGTLIKVDSTGGSVTLKGKVESLKARESAGADARNTPGVTQVYNLVEVDPTNPPSDEELGEALRMLMVMDSLMMGRLIEVEVDSGVVSLRGEVESEFQRQRGEDLASRAIGVTEVKNHLRVDLSTSSSSEKSD